MGGEVETIRLARAIAKGDVPWPASQRIEVLCDLADALVAERERAVKKALELAALMLASHGGTDTANADMIPQGVWDELHDSGLIVTGQLYPGGDAVTYTTRKGDDALYGLVAALTGGEAP